MGFERRQLRDQTKRPNADRLSRKLEDHEEQGMRFHDQLEENEK